MLRIEDKPSTYAYRRIQDQSLSLSVKPVKVIVAINKDRIE